MHTCQQVSHSLMCSVFCLLLLFFFVRKNKAIPEKSLCTQSSLLVNEKRYAEKLCSLWPRAHWHNDDSDGNKASAPSHTLFSLTCFESITNSFISCSNRMPVFVVMCWKAITSEQMHSFNVPVCPSTSRFHWHQWFYVQPWNQDCMAAPLCWTTGSPSAATSASFSPFVPTIKTILCLILQAAHHCLAPSDGALIAPGSFLFYI